MRSCRRRAGLAVRLRVLRAAGIHRHLQLGHYFPIAFAACAIGTAIAGFINSRFVDRLGMRVISHGALLGYVAISGIMLAAAKLQMLPLPLFMALSALMMFSFGLMISNFTALAMEPQGRIAGTAASLYGSITTLLGIGIGTKMGQDYDGTLLPFAPASSSARWPRWRWCWWWKRAGCSSRIASRCSSVPDHVVTCLRSDHSRRLTVHNPALRCLFQVPAPG
jgi:hypothetical protein